jgi:hypothetical protein
VGARLPAELMLLTDAIRLAGAAARNAAGARWLVRLAEVLHCTIAGWAQAAMDAAIVIE